MQLILLLWSLKILIEFLFLSDIHKDSHQFIGSIIYVGYGNRIFQANIWNKLISFPAHIPFLITCVQGSKERKLINFLLLCFN